ncbi:nocturnin-like, partial [Condylostylus longicornis]|uniref:nocturnin-like n=1 Tax=Condylostylus longicornis TaxID=2530218 RepID=UPI00244DDA3D
MQSHQSSLSQENHKNNILCHKRRPSIGKSMPVTALLLNYPPPSKGYETLGTDGLLPEELEKPPLYFRVHESNNELTDDINQNFEDFDDTSYEFVNHNEKVDNNNDNLFEIINPSS